MPSWIILELKNTISLPYCHRYEAAVQTMNAQGIMIILPLPVDILRDGVGGVETDAVAWRTRDGFVLL